jgi:glycosyltransferase involved in cell wall biosynthesis
MPVISVIIPAYNAERTILETIQSVLTQSFSDFELIVINDGSTDKTLSLVSSITDPRLKVFSYSNGGLSVARNRGIERSTGQFISFLDADDLWTSDKLECQLLALQASSKAGAAYSWTCNMSAAGDSFYPGCSVSYNGDVYSKLLVRNFIASGSNCLIRREAIDSAGTFDPSLRSYEDWDYWLRIAPHWLFVVVPKYQILYRQSLGAMSSKIDVMQEYGLIVIEKAFQSAPNSLKSLKRKCLGMNYHYLAGMCLANVNEQENWRKAGEKLWKATYYHPRIFFTKETQFYLLKWLFLRIFSPKIAKSFTGFVRLSKNISDPRLQN